MNYVSTDNIECQSTAIYHLKFVITFYSLFIFLFFDIYFDLILSNCINVYHFEIYTASTDIRVFKTVVLKKENSKKNIC